MDGSSLAALSFGSGLVFLSHYFCFYSVCGVCSDLFLGSFDLMLFDLIGLIASGCPGIDVPGYYLKCELHVYIFGFVVVFLAWK